MSGEDDFEGDFDEEAASRTAVSVDVTGLSLYTHHGVSEAEREIGQRLVFDLSFDDTVYIRSLQRRGTNLLEEPKIKLSTIHAMKGGEDQKIMLLTDSTKNCATSPDQDNEHRVFYTGGSRAKEELHVIESSRKYRYIV